MSHVGDYPLPLGFTVKDMGKCHHAVGFPGIAYEVGIIEVNKLPADHPARLAVDAKGKRLYPDGAFVPMFDFYNYQLKQKMEMTQVAKGDVRVLRFIQTYREECSLNEVRRKGNKNIKKTVDENGMVILVATK